MKALLLTAYNHLEYTDFPDPEPGPGEVMIQVKTCGICGSDIHGLDGSSGRRIPPLIMGHEAAGVIAAVGRPDASSGDASSGDASSGRVSGWQIGDRVTFDSTIYCGTCHFCRRGEINLCDNRRVLGVSPGDYRQHGAFAEYVVVPQHILYRLPEGLSFERAAMVEAVSIAVHAVERTPVALNDTAVVVGTGMIGLLVVQALRVAGCGKVIAVDLDAARLELARQLGADLALNPQETDVLEQVLAQTEGRGADIAVEVVGFTPTLQTAIQSVRKGGTVTLVGNLSPTTEFLQQSVVTRELTLYGSCGSRGEYPACLDLIVRGDIHVDSMISAVAPLSEGASWFKRLYDGEPGLMKVILTP